MMAKLDIQKRRRTRRFILQALYQWHIDPQPVQILIERFLQAPEMHDADIEFFTSMVSNIIREQVRLDEILQPILQASQSTVQSVELSILRIGTYELKDCLETPYRVIVNEAIELSKDFCDNRSHKYINGVLHRVATQFRSMEMHKTQSSS